MKIFFEQSNVLLFLLPAIVLIVLLVWFTYSSQTEKSFYTSGQRKVLALLRSCALALVAILLLAPAFQLYQTYKKKPIIIIASDNSESVFEYQKLSEELVNKVIGALSDFRVEPWTFGETPQKNGKISFSEVRSDYSALFNTIQNTYLPSSVSAMVIIGDGIFNSGSDPVYTSRSVSYPVFAIGVGDTTQQMDAAILNVEHNQTAFLDNYFPVAINLSFKNLSGKTSELRIWQGNEVVTQKQVDIDNNDFFQQEQIRLKAEKTGILNYRVEINEFEGEKNVANNQYNFSIRVVNQKQKILMVSNGANPDNAALIRSIRPQKNYDFKLIVGTNEKITPADYDLIVLDQVPDKTSANGALLTDILKSKKPILWLIGVNTELTRLNALSPGFRFNAIKNYEFATPSINKEFDFFQMEDYWSEQIGAWPPLQVPFAEIDLDGNWQTLAYQSVQQIDLTRPLISLGRVDGIKTALISGEGIWKWRVYDFMQNGTNEIYDNLFLKLINYLILKPNEDNFNLYHNDIYAEDQDIILNAELLDENYEQINGPEVTLSITDPDGNKYDYAFDKTENSYQLNIGKLPAGNYSLLAAVNYGGKQLTENGSFRIDRIQLEQTNLQADFNTLFQIAETTGGKFATANNIDEIFQAIKSNKHLTTQKFQQMVFKELIKLKWLAIFIILLFSMEWFLRKYWGSY